MYKEARRIEKQQGYIFLFWTVELSVANESIIDKGEYMASGSGSELSIVEG